MGSITPHLFLPHANQSLLQSNSGGNHFCKEMCIDQIKCEHPVDPSASETRMVQKEDEHVSCSNIQVGRGSSGHWEHS